MEMQEMHKHNALVSTVAYLLLKKPEDANIMLRLLRSKITQEEWAMIIQQAKNQIKDKVFQNEFTNTALKILERSKIGEGYVSDIKRK